MVVVELGLPLCHPASGNPLLDLVDEASIASCEVLGAQVKGTGIAALAGHATTAAVPLVEQVDGLSCFLKSLGR
ncbi:hypothetical protein D3C78_1740360 [compost metagenome]